MHPRSIPTNSGPIFSRFVTLSSRLDSFKSWKYYNIQNPQKLARAGFFSCGSSDRVVCFYCARALWKWEAGDDPWIEHASSEPNCAFLLLNWNTRNEIILEVIIKAQFTAFVN